MGAPQPRAGYVDAPVVDGVNPLSACLALAPPVDSINAGTLNVIYINRSIMECVDAATTRADTAAGRLAVCDLKADGRMLLLLLSVLTVRSCWRIHASCPYLHLRLRTRVCLAVGGDVRHQDH
jgi:hypothetical protein